MGENRFEIPKVRITDEAGDRDFHIAEVAEVIGEADRSDALKEEEEIYTPQNRELVVESSRLVATLDRLEQEEEGGAPRLSFDELHKLIEKALWKMMPMMLLKVCVFSRSNNGGINGLIG